MTAPETAPPRRRRGRRLIVWVAAVLGGIVLLVVADRVVIGLAERKTAAELEKHWDATSVDVDLRVPSGLAALASRNWDEVRIRAVDPHFKTDIISRLDLELVDVRFERRAGGAELTGRSGRARIELSLDSMRSSLGPAGRFFAVKEGKSEAKIEIDIPVVGEVTATLDVAGGELRLRIDDVSVLGSDVDVPAALESTTWPMPIPATTELDSVDAEGDTIRLDLSFGEFAIDSHGEFVEP